METPDLLVLLVLLAIALIMFFYVRRMLSKHPDVTIDVEKTARFIAEMLEQAEEFEEDALFELEMAREAAENKDVSLVRSSENRIQNCILQIEKLQGKLGEFNINSPEVDRHLKNVRRMHETITAILNNLTTLDS